MRGKFSGVLPGFEMVRNEPPNGDATLSEVAPGQYVSSVPMEEVPKYVVSKLVPTGDGKYRLELVDESPGYMKITDVARRLNLDGLKWKMLRRLLAGGFVEYIQPTPGCYMIQLDSLMRHLERTANRDPDDPYWTEERMKIWRETYVV